MERDRIDSAETLLNVITPHIKAQLLEILEEAARIAKAHYVDDRPPVIKGEFTYSNDSRCINAGINSAFANDILGNSFPYPTHTEKLKGPVSPVTRVELPIATVHFAKARDKKSLPYPAVYRKKWAANNTFQNDGQLKIVIDDEEKSLEIGREKFSILITYGLNRQKELDFVRIMVPDHQFDSYLYEEDLYKYRGMKIQKVDGPKQKKSQARPKRNISSNRSNEDGK